MHIVKLAVGADSVEDIAVWQRSQVARFGRPVCGTRQVPKQADAIAGKGSLYWVIKGAILVRQGIVEIAPVTDDHGLRCGLWLDPALHRTAPQPRRAFQGWRYLDLADAPADLNEIRGGADLPDALRRELVALGAW